MNKKNWIGNKNSIYKTLGASNHTKENREENDYYATDPKAAELLLELETFKNILEPSCGEGHLSKVFADAGLNVTSSDLVDRCYGTKKSFFDYEKWNGDIITNPPYKYGLEFVEHALKIIPEGNKVAMFLKIQFLEGKKRKNFLYLTHLKHFTFQVVGCFVLKTQTLKACEKVAEVLLLMVGLYGKKDLKAKPQ